MEPNWVWGIDWASFGEIMRFFMCCTWLLVCFVAGIKVMQWVLYLLWRKKDDKQLS